MPSPNPTVKESQRWTQLRALAATRPGFAAIADGLIDPECGALPLAEAIPQLEAMITRIGMALPAPEPEPAVETLAECLAAIELPKPIPRLVPLASSSDVDPATLPARAGPTYHQVAAVFCECCDKYGDTLEFLTKREPSPEARRLTMLKALRHQAALWLQPLGVGACRSPDTMLAEMAWGGKLLEQLDAWDRGEGCETEPARPAKVKPVPARPAAADESPAVMAEPKGANAGLASKPIKWFKTQRALA